MKDTKEVFIKRIKVPEHIIDIPGSVFEILVKVHNLSHVVDNIYQSVDGRKFHLTKYGLEPNELFNMNELQKMLTAEREKTANQLAEIKRLTEKIEKLKTR